MRTKDDYDQGRAAVAYNALRKERALEALRRAIEVVEDGGALVSIDYRNGTWTPEGEPRYVTSYYSA